MHAWLGNSFSSFPNVLTLSCVCLNLLPCLSRPEQLLTMKSYRKTMKDMLFSAGFYSLFLAELWSCSYYQNFKVVDSEMDVSKVSCFVRPDI